MTIQFFETPEKLRNWFNKHHQKETELFVGYYKVGSGKPSITWPQSVDQALCFGWIDGVRKSINKESYCIRFTPRKQGSIWSLINIAKVKELQKSGWMKPEGQKAFDQRTEHKSGLYAHEKAAVQLPLLYEKKFKLNKSAWSYFQQQAPSYIKRISNWIMEAKQEQTRLLRLEKTIEASAHLKRLR